MQVTTTYIIPGHTAKQTGSNFNIIYDFWMNDESGIYRHIDWIWKQQSHICTMSTMTIVMNAFLITVRGFSIESVL